MTRAWIQIVLSEEDKQAIEKRARKERLPLATWCRRVLIRELEKEQ